MDRLLFIRFRIPKGAPIQQLLSYADGSVLAGTSNGLMGWRDGRSLTLTRKNGPPCEQVYAMAFDLRGSPTVTDRLELLNDVEQTGCHSLEGLSNSHVAMFFNCEQEPFRHLVPPVMKDVLPLQRCDCGERNVQDHDTHDAVGGAVIGTALEWGATYCEAID